MSPDDHPPATFVAKLKPRDLVDIYRSEAKLLRQRARRFPLRWRGGEAAKLNREADEFEAEADRLERSA